MSDTLVDTLPAPISNSLTRSLLRCLQTVTHSLTHSLTHSQSFHAAEPTNGLVFGRLCPQPPPTHHAQRPDKSTDGRTDGRRTTGDGWMGDADGQTGRTGAGQRADKRARKQRVSVSASLRASPCVRVGLCALRGCAARRAWGVALSTVSRLMSR